MQHLEEISNPNYWVEQKLVNVDLEQLILGSLLMKEAFFDKFATRLSEGDFYTDIHQNVLASMFKARDDGRVPNPINIKADFIDYWKHAPDDIVDADEYIARLVSVALDNEEQVRRSIVMLQDLRRRRAIHTAGNVIAARALDAPITTKAVDLFNDAYKELEAARGVAGEGDHHEKLHSVLQSFVRTIGDAYKNTAPIGYELCLPSLVSIFGPRLIPGRMTGLLGDSGGGKTAFAVQQIKHNAKKGEPGLFISFEQTRFECLAQMFAQELSLESEQMLDGAMEVREMDRIVEEAQTMITNKMPLSIEAGVTGLDVEGVVSLIRGFVRSYGPGVVAIDHAVHIRPSNPRAQFFETVQHIYSSLKDAAQDLDCHIILLMQKKMRDYPRDRIIPRPVWTDGFGGTMTMTNLDTYVAIYRPEKWLRFAVREHPESVKLQAELNKWTARAEFINMKRRQGAEGHEQLTRFLGQYTRFEMLPAQQRRQQELLDINFD